MVDRPPDPQLLRFLEAYDRPVADLALGLREIILEEAPSASESIYQVYTVAIWFGFIAAYSGASERRRWWRCSRTYPSSLRNSGRLMQEIRTLRAERAKTDPDLVYNEQTDPAAAWYRKLLAQAERIDAARKQQAKHHEPEAAQPATQTSDAAKSTPPTKISFGNNPIPAPAQPLEPKPQWHEIPQYIRDQHRSLRTAAA
jgi:hypothetical protein